MKRKLLLSLSSIGCGCMFALLFFTLLYLPTTLYAKAFSAENFPAQAIEPTAQQRDVQKTSSYAQAQPDDEQDFNEVRFVTYTPIFSDIQIITSSANVSGVNQLARELALAMNITESIILSASLCDSTTGECSDAAGLAVLGTAPGTWFPTRGRNFALLSTGRITDAINHERGVAETLSPSQVVTIESLAGLNNEYGHDLVQLHLTLQAPTNARCLSFDYTFYTVDIYSDTSALACSSPQGDTFTTQYNHFGLDLKGEIA
jgi:hypothetical protein